MALQPFKQSEFPVPAKHSHAKLKNGFSAPQSVDARWTEAVLMDDNELEEGEACDDPDSGCDPDTAFSYIDEKLVLVLGDVQKEFEGGVSAEKLGSKFGGYGSFLPTHERAPSVLHDQRPAGLVSNDAPRPKKSPNEGIVERMKRAAAGLSIGVVNDKACAGPVPLLSEDGGRPLGPVNEKMSNAGGMFPATKAEENSGHKNKVTLRIKMGSDADARKKNTSIYSDFGLTDSSSASLEDDDDDQRSDSDMESSPDRTPLTMIRIMTSHQLPEGLLSPLPDLVSEPFLHEEKVRLVTREGKKPKLSVSSKADFGHDVALVKVELEAEKVDSYKEKTRESLSEWKDDNDLGLDFGRKVKKEDLDKVSLREASKNISKHPTRAVGKDSSKLSEAAFERQERDCVSESGTGVMPFEISRESKRSFRDKGALECPMEVEHTPNDLGSPFESLKEVESSRKSSSRGSKADKGTSHVHDILKEQLDVLHKVRDPGKEVPPFDAGVLGKKHHDINGELIEGKKRSGLRESIVSHEGKMKASKDSSKSSSKSKGTGRFDNSATTRELVKAEPEGKKKAKDIGKEGQICRSSSNKKTKEVSKEAWKSSGKDANIRETAVRDKEGRRDPSRPVVKDPLKDSGKESKKEASEPRRKEKVKEEMGAELSSKDLSRFCEKDRQKELAVLCHVTVKATDSSLPNMQHTEANGRDQPMELGGLPWSSRENRLPNPALSAPNLTIITENWVCCDRCETWRLLPPGVETDQLPKKWWCEMLYWLDGMNNCNVSEEETRLATEALYTPMPAKPPAQLDPLAQPSSVVPVLPGSTRLGSLGQEAAFTEKTKATAGKKRKVLPTVSNELASTKTKIQADVPMNQDGTQGRLGSEDSIHMQMVEEKRRSKEREKKRLRANDGASPLAKENGQTLASIAIKEAKDLKHHADRLKGKDGMERESTDFYLKAALKFLHAAAMMELAQAEGAENGDPSAIYTDTAKLCMFCAAVYERNKEMAAAALAYKCAGLARMRVVQAKRLGAIKDRAELQSAHQQGPPGDSPYLSVAQDLDNLNNLSIDRFPAKGAASPCLGAQTGGNLILPGRCRSSFNRILQYVADTNAAVEALSKSSNAFAVAEEALHSSVGEEGMLAVKRVMDFGFHDVERMLSLVRKAMEEIGH